MTQILPRRQVKAQRSPQGAPAPMKSVGVKPWGQWAAAVVVTVLLANVLVSLAKNKNIHYSTVGEFLFSQPVLEGLYRTFTLSLISMLVGVLLGVLIALMKMSRNRVLEGIASGYVWFFRGVPLLVQMLVWGNFALLFPQLGIGIPFTDIVFLQVKTNSIIVPFVAACLGLGLHEGAYMAEVVRGGFLAVDRGQQEAAAAIGMKHSMMMRRIVLPQAIRVIIPATGNQFISLVKASSLVSVIAGGELLTAVQNISASNYQTIELLFVASFWYLVFVTVLSIGQFFLEKRASKGHVR
jgi:polar amino acid transport system permease protein